VSEKIVVSSCLLGFACRYDGASRKYDMSGTMRDFTPVPVCPEQLGGLPTPREPAELRASEDGGVRVIRLYSGEDVTDQFIDGARQVLDFCLQNGIKKACLKSKSPSCGEDGITANMLRENGIEVTIVG